MSKLRVGFIGAGRIADLHVLAYRDNPEAEIYAVCDSQEEVARQRAHEWGVQRSLTDYRELLRDEALDAVEILTPHRLHAEMTVAALESGKHVSLQKPPALNLRETDAMIAAAQRSGRLFRVCENFRYYPPFVKAKALLDQGAIGEPLSIRVKVINGSPQFGWPVAPEAWRWRFTEAECGGGPAIFDHGYHIFSIVMYFLGPVEKVFAWIEWRELGQGLVSDVPAMIVWKHSQGLRYGCWETVGSLEMMVRSKYYANDEWVEITGSRGLIWINRCSGMMLEGPPLVLYRDGETRAFHTLDSDWSVSFVHAGRDFLAAIREGRQCSLTGSEARDILQFSLAAHRSAREGREIRLEEVTD
ncbi:MAG: Gfo/Idh/MocA family protein [Dehalococcoidia bacterium]